MGNCPGLFELIFILIEHWMSGRIFQGLEMSDFANGMLAITGKELCEERDEAMSVCKD